MTNLVEVKVTENNKGIAVFNVDLGLTLTDVTIEYDVTLTESGSIIAMGLNTMTIKNQKGEFKFVSNGKHGFKGVGRGRKPNSIIDIAVTSLDVVETEMILGTFDNEIFVALNQTEVIEKVISDTETVNTNKLGKEVDCMKIESINRVTENIMEVTFVEKNMTASILVERVEEDEMSFTLKNATFDEYEFTRKERTHSIIELAGEVQQSITDKVQKFIDNIFYLNACPMTKEDVKMYDQIMESFDQTEEQTETSEEEKEETEEINNTTAAGNKTVTENKEVTNTFNAIERKNEVNSVKKPWLTMTGKVFNGKKARAIENLLEDVLIGKDKKFATQKSIENILKENNVNGHIVTYHIKQLKNNAYEYIYTIDELETALTIGIDEHGKIEDVI